MENAGRAGAQEILTRWRSKRIVILSGPGNNGGDGFVVARYLREADWPVRIFGAPGSPLAQEMASRLEGISPLHQATTDNCDLIIDALFGTGLNRPLEEPWLSLIEKINAAGVPIVSLDLPSGINSDTGEIMGAAITATLTIAFDSAKPAHFLYPGKEFRGNLVLKDIGIPDMAPEGHDIFLNHPPRWKHCFHAPTWQDHKFTRGSVLIIGSSEMLGAAKMAAVAARRVGAGYVTLMVPSYISPALQAETLGTIIHLYQSPHDIENSIESGRYNAVVIGPGMPPNQTTCEIVSLILDSRIPTVVDGGALSAFENQNEALFKKLHDKTVITPHEGEFLRLFPTLKQEPRLQKAILGAAQTTATLVLKGADTIITQDARIAIQPFASPWLSTAGTGDILAGIIGAFLSQNIAPFDAASAAVWVHAAAAQSAGSYMIAEDLLSALQQTLRTLF